MIDKIKKILGIKTKVTYHVSILAIKEGQYHVKSVIIDTDYSLKDETGYVAFKHEIKAQLFLGDDTSVVILSINKIY